MNEFFNLKDMDELHAWLEKYTTVRRATLCERFEAVFIDVRSKLDGQGMMVQHSMGKFEKERDGLIYPMFALRIVSHPFKTYECIVGFVTDMESTEVLTINYTPQDKLNEVLTLYTD